LHELSSPVKFAVVACPPLNSLNTQPHHTISDPFELFPSWIYHGSTKFRSSSFSVRRRSKKGSSATSRQAAGIDLLERKFSQRAVDPSFRRLPAAAPTTGSESSLRPRSTRFLRRRTRRQGRVYRSRKGGILQNFIACLRVSTTRCTCPELSPSSAVLGMFCCSSTLPTLLGFDVIAMWWIGMMHAFSGCWD
jgi:hypothetical protein